MVMTSRDAGFMAIPPAHRLAEARGCEAVIAALASYRNVYSISTLNAGISILNFADEPAKDSGEDMIRIAVLGAGRIGRIHGRNAAAIRDARLVAVADPHAAARRRSSPRRRAREVASIEEIVERSDVDAILICTPTDTHADLIERGARAGKAVFCEKPVDLSSARIETCLAIVEKAGTPLMIGFNRRFDPNFAAPAAGVWPTARSATSSSSRILSRDPGPPPVELHRHARAACSAT